VLCKVKHAEQHLFPINVNSGASLEALKQNMKLRREAVEYLKSGGCVLLFPSGMPEITEDPFSEPKEAPWTSFMASVALSAAVPVLPMFVPGHNTRLFHIASWISKKLRPALIPYETSRRYDSTIEVIIGKLFSVEQLSETSSRDELTQLIRDATLALEAKEASLPQ
jgi:putative hemolysin